MIQKFILGRNKVVELLVQHGSILSANEALIEAATRGKKTTKLHNQPNCKWIYISGDETAVQILINLGADVSTKDRYQNTPLHWASRWGIEMKSKQLSK